MDQTNQLPAFNVAFSNLYSSSLDLVEQEQQFDTSEQQPTYRGMPVQAVDSFPIHNSRSDVYQNEIDHSNSLNEYYIESLTNFDSENPSGTIIQEIQQSILGEYVPYPSDNELVNDALSPSTPYIQLLISRDEPAISVQTPANHTCPDIQLTNSPVEIHCSQDSRPVTVVNPLCMYQATQAEVNVDGSCSLVERQRERMADPEKRKLKNQRARERMADPEKRQLKNQRERERMADPEKRKLKNQRERERKADPEKRKLKSQRQKASPEISLSGAISQFSYITEPMPTSSNH